MRIILLALAVLTFLVGCPKPVPATFPCADTKPRADGTQQSGTPCVTGQEYCYEASGGAAISHGAQCKKLPKAGATCADIQTLVGAACTVTPEGGLRVQMVFP